MRTFIHLLVIFNLGNIGCSLANAEPFIGLKIVSSAMSVDGQVYGIVNGENGQHVMQFNAGGSWQHLEVELPAAVKDLVPSCITTSRTNGVFSIWESVGNDYKLAVVRHYKGKNELVGELALVNGNINTPHTESQIAEDGFGYLWLVHQSPFVLRVDLKEKKILERRLDDSYFSGTRFTDRMLSPGVPQITPLSITTDKKGQVWFYSQDNQGWGNRLNGLLVFDGTDFHHVSSVKGISWFWPTKDVMAFSPKDRSTMYGIVRGVGVFEIDNSDFSAVPILEPEPRALTSAWSIFNGGSSLWIAALWGAELDSEGWVRRSGVEAKTRFWRQESGVWTNPLSVKAMPDSKVVILPSAKATWIGSSTEGAWYIPKGGEPVYLDWQRCNPLRSINWIYPVQGEGALLISAERGSVVHRGERSFCKINEDGSRTDFLPFYPFEGKLLVGTDKNVWFMRQEGENLALRRWNGFDFTDFELPSRITSPGGWHIRQSTNGDVWLIAYDAKNTLVLSPSSKKWRSYNDFNAAILSEKSSNIESVNLHNSQEELAYSDEFNTYVPVFGRKGEVAYFSDGGKLIYFDGSRWDYWDRTRPMNSARAYEITLGINSEKGSLTMLHRKSGECQEYLGGAWQPCPITNFVPAPSQVGASQPNYCDARPSHTGVLDKEGKWWSNTDSGVLVGVGELCGNPYKIDTRAPFVDGRRIDRVYLDASNNHIFETRLGNSTMEYFVALDGKFAPTAEIRILEISALNVKVKFEATGRGPFKYQTRMDNEQWSNWTTSDEKVYEWLSPGDHTLSLRVVDSQVRSSETTLSLVAKGESLEETQKQILSVLTTGTEEQRNRAIDNIHRFPGIRKNLIELRKTADSSTRWWLDLAIQEIDSRSAGVDIRKE